MRPQRLLRPLRSLRSLRHLDHGPPLGHLICCCHCRCLCHAHCPLPLFLLFCLPLAYLLFKFNLHYLKNLKSKNFSCANQHSAGGSHCFSWLRSRPAFEQLFCFNIFIYLRPGNFCLFLASFYDSGPSAPKMSLIVAKTYINFSLHLLPLLLPPPLLSTFSYVCLLRTSFVFKFALP